MRALPGVPIGPAALHLDLSLSTWAADGLLAIFFFVAGLELKREFVAGDLRDPRKAALPVAAAAGGMAAPALIYVGLNAGVGGGALAGWAAPSPSCRARCATRRRRSPRTSSSAARPTSSGSRASSR